MAITYSLVPEELGLQEPILVGAFMGWPDAALGASGAVRYLIESLNAAPLATWDGDEYYDFVELRPVSRVVPPRDRILIWPQAEFWVVREVAVRAQGGQSGEGEAGGSPRRRSLVLFLAHEPRLRWRSYSRELVAFAQRCGVRQSAFFGASFADVPHTREPTVTGWATETRLSTRLEAQGINFSAYQGPSSMQSAAIEACREAGIASASLFSNGPAYLTIPNANLSLALLRRFTGLFQLDVDLNPLREAAAALTRQVSAAIEERSDAEFRDHVRRLESRFDAESAPLAPGELRRQQELEDEAASEAAEAGSALNVDPQEVVRELEDFLRRRNQQQRETDGGGDGPDGGGDGQDGDDGQSGSEDDGGVGPGGARPGPEGTPR
jgi:hypothetical protein